MRFREFFTVALLLLPFPVFADGHTEDTILIPVDPTILQPSPTCILDPCLCGWCPEESGPQLLGPLTPGALSAPTLPGMIDLEGIAAIQNAVPKELNNCPPQHIRPWGTIRENYFYREEQQDCTRSVLELMEVESELYIGIVGNGLSWLSEEDRSRVEASYRNYTSTCLQSLNDTTAETSSEDRSRVLRNATAPGQVERLFDNVGRLTAGVNGHTCTAAIASTSRGPALLTAAHCLGDVEVDAGQENGRRLTVFARLEFTSFSGKTASFNIDTDLDGFTYNLGNEDVAGTFISEGQPGFEGGDGLPLLGSPLREWEPLLIVGENPYLSAVNLVDGLSGHEHLQASFVASLEPSCQYRGADNGSLNYFCQTARGMSGSPILVVRDGRFYIAGVHNRRATSMGPLSCDSGALVGGANAGIAILEHVFD